MRVKKIGAVVRILRNRNRGSASPSRRPIGKAHLLIHLESRIPFQKIKIVGLINPCGGNVLVIVVNLNVQFVQFSEPIFKERRILDNRLRDACITELPHENLGAHQLHLTRCLIRYHVILGHRDIHIIKPLLVIDIHIQIQIARRGYVHDRTEKVKLCGGGIN